MVDQPLQQQAVGLYHMVQGNPVSADLLLEGIQPCYKGIMLPFMGLVARIPVLSLESLLVTEMMDDIPVQKTEQPLQFIDPLTGLAGSQ